MQHIKRTFVSASLNSSTNTETVSLGFLNSISDLAFSLEPMFTYSSGPKGKMRTQQKAHFEGFPFGGLAVTSLAFTAGHLCTSCLNKGGPSVHPHKTRAS